MKEVIPLHKKEAAEDTISAASKLRMGFSTLLFPCLIILLISINNN